MAGMDGYDVPICGPPGFTRTAAVGTFCLSTADEEESALINGATGMEDNGEADANPGDQGFQALHDA